MNYSKRELLYLAIWCFFWLAVALILPAVAASTQCAVPGLQAATVTEIYANGSTRTLVGRVIGWQYSNGAMQVAYRSDGLAVSGFDQ